MEPAACVGYMLSDIKRVYLPPQEEPMKPLTLQEHRARIANLCRAREDIHACTRELRIHDYLPGQVIYYLGDYPAPMSITPTEYDEALPFSR